MLCFFCDQVAEQLRALRASTEAMSSRTHHHDEEDDDEDDDDDYGDEGDKYSIGKLYWVYSIILWCTGITLWKCWEKNA